MGWIGVLKRCCGFAALVTSVIFTACGGGGTSLGGSGTGSGSNAANSPDFSLSTSPSSVTLAPTASETLQVGYSPLNGFSGGVQVAASGLPVGVTLQPGSPFAIAAAGTFVTINVGSSTASGTYPIQLQATSGSLSHSATFTLAVTSGTATAVSFPPSRSGFLPLGQNPFAAVFDPVHKIVFASLPWLDAVDVVSTTTNQLIATIPIPGPEGLDLTLDDSELLVGTTTNQFFTVDTRRLAVVARTTLPVQNPQGSSVYLQPQWPVVTANGTILIVATGDFPVGVFQWNPVLGTLTPRPDASVGNSTRAARSTDGSKVLLWDWFGGGASIYDARTDTFTRFQNALLGYLQGYTIFPVAGAVNPTGTEVAVGTYGPVIVTDGSGNLMKELDVGGCFGLQYTVDGKYLLILSSSGVSFEILTVDATTFNLIGTAPAYASYPLGVTSVFPWSPNLYPAISLTVDDTGLVYGAADHGLSIDNSKNFQNLGSGTGNAIIASMSPMEGALNSAVNASISIHTGGVVGTPTVYVGSQPATNVSAPQSFQVQFTVPPSNTPGVETIQVQQAGGVTSDFPLLFSYGSSLVPQPQQAVPPTGGATVDLFGYGLGVDLSSFSTSVFIGGQSAPVTSHSEGVAVSYSYPFPIQHLQVTAPAGSPGPADILVATPVGAATFAKGIDYLQNFQEVTSTDIFSSLTYDSSRNRLYLAAGDHVDVFNLGTNSFLPSLSLPTTKGSKKATGLTVTPDNSKLLVSNQTDGSIGVIDLNNPSNTIAVSIPFTPLVPDPNCSQGPGQIAVSDAGKAYAIIIESGIDSCPSIGVVELDVPSLTARHISEGANPVGYIYTGNVVASRNGKAMAINNGWNIYLLDTSTDSWRSRPLDSNANLYDVAVPADGDLAVLRTTTYGIGTGFPLGESYRDRYIGVDSNMNVIASLVTPEYSQNTGGGNRNPGMQVNDSGSLIYAVQNQEIDLFDVHHGDQRERILLPKGVQIGNSNLTQTAIDETGARFFAITQSGVCVITLDSVPLSIGSVNPSIGSSAGGIQLTIRGSGFVSGANVAFGNVAVAATVVDSNTLQVITPPMTQGAIQIIVQNGNGQTYTLDDAYTAN
jgi:hypothetical protein